MIQYLSQRSCCSHLVLFAILFALLSTSAARPGSTAAPTAAATAAPTTAPSGCSAEITLNSTQYGTAFYIYHDIIVENTGLCDITNVFVDITLPPNDSVFLYGNVSNSTGELFGLSTPMPQGSVQTGGVLVMDSARIPLVKVGKLECSTTCNTAGKTPSSPDSSPDNVSVPTDLPAETSSDAESSSSVAEASSSSSGDESASSDDEPSSSTIQIEIRSGSNPYWFGLNVLSGGAAVEPKNVQFRDSSSGAWSSMNVAYWGSIPTYTYSPTTGAPLALPLSLKLTSNSNEEIILDEIITSFAPSTFTSQATYSTSKRAQKEGGDVTAF